MKNPKILYVSCHTILEYDELRMFRDLGLSFLSLGAYITPSVPHVNSRPALEGCNIITGAMADYNRMCNVEVGKDTSRIFTKEFLDHFDVIIVMHIPDWITKNWGVLKGRNVVWRTIGQSIPSVEKQLEPCRKEGLKIVRYSPMERQISGYIGEDALIRFAKYKEDFKPWTGELEEIVTIGQSMKQRGWFCNYDLYMEVTKELPSKLYGHGNEGAEIGSYDELTTILSQNRVYFYTGTKPASYTLNFIEAAMAGIPIVSIGQESARFEGHDYFEVVPLLEKYRSGFFSDDAEQLRKYIQLLLSDRSMADYTSHKLLKMSHELFDAATIRPEWDRFFDSI